MAALLSAMPSPPGFACVSCGRAQVRERGGPGHPRHKGEGQQAPGGGTKSAGEGEELKSTKDSRGSKGTTDGRASSLAAAVVVVVAEEGEEEEEEEVERVRQAAMTLQKGGRSSRSRRVEAERAAVEEEVVQCVKERGAGGLQRGHKEACEELVRLVAAQLVMQSYHCVRPS
ncbi:hypothetical protein PHYSODRAFT_263482 [Phytophthora sojae]|uniref:Uncharacterized protein n=1 Tax=Phytophthora sojae (strain P6497) TaxID=1094619 RepID=G4YHP6_PHYSP|nr:hypothetical protein PHYSODRAFT_263482 [Phytophthora sojae]EGZ29364.1 hypothetical protein PHYSODRAFT_263482 [Phytophthora sojae]|eukprot:XP_009516639.1 hypothetical protein PHYSODRAFT_263482 [Phytophthora sojae]